MPRLVTARSIFVPCCCLEATTVIFCVVHLRTATCATRVAITVFAAVLFMRICHVEVVVHATMSVAQVHIPFHRAATQIEAGFRTHPALPFNIPALRTPCHLAWWPLHLFLKVLRSFRAILFETHR